MCLRLPYVKVYFIVIKRKGTSIHGVNYTHNKIVHPELLRYNLLLYALFTYSVHVIRLLLCTKINKSNIHVTITVGGYAFPYCNML